MDLNYIAVERRMIWDAFSCVRLNSSIEDRFRVVLHAVITSLCFREDSRVHCLVVRCKICVLCTRQGCVTHHSLSAFKRYITPVSSPSAADHMSSLTVFWGVVTDLSTHRCSSSTQDPVWSHSSIRPLVSSKYLVIRLHAGGLFTVHWAEGPGTHRTGRGSYRQTHSQSQLMWLS